MENADDSQFQFIEWGKEMDKRPAPVLLALLSGFTFVVANSSSVKTLYAMSIICGLYSIQITIWRAAQMIARILDRANTRS